MTFADHSQCITLGELITIAADLVGDLDNVTSDYARGIVQMICTAFGINTDQSFIVNHMIVQEMLYQKLLEEKNEVNAENLRLKGV